MIVPYKVRYSEYDVCFLLGLNELALRAMDEFENCTIDLNVYTCSDKGLVLPIFSEYTWPIPARAIIYGGALIWCFLGVAIIADIFMCSIEKITSKTHIIKIANSQAENGYDSIEVQVWNDTVANLTLMALGSSAPEIMLSCIELIGNRFVAKDLGPSTIVGSAAFNLLVITAVCMLSIPSPDIRRIKHINVFFVTATFSIFAYLWLVIILVGVTPNQVDLWEAIITFLMFPGLVVLAYFADICKKRKKKDVNDPEVKVEMGRTDKAVALLQNGGGFKSVDYDSDDEINTEGMTDEKMRMFLKELPYADMPEDSVAKLAANRVEESKRHHHLWYRINATRNIAGNHALLYKVDVDGQVELPREGRKESVMAGSPTDLSEDNKKAVVEFVAFQSAVLECEKKVSLVIRRWGNRSNRVAVKIETIDGTAEAGSDYIPVKRTLIFEKDEVYKNMDIEIVDDNVWEPDEVFFVKLSLDLTDPGAKSAVIGRKAVQEIIIINDDEPGTFQFTKASLLFKESVGKVHIPVERTNGADGKVDIHWTTEDMTAKNGFDFMGGSGTLTFEHGEMTKMLEIKIMDDKEEEKDRCFKVDLVDCSEGAKLGRIRKTIVSIVSDDDFNGMVSRLVDMANMNVEALQVDSNTYADQFRNAMNVNGGDTENASNLDYVMHFCTFAWKLLFAFVPPVSFCGGWMAFFSSLFMIGVLTMIVGDLAGIFGCLVGLKDSVTAITFVALGTSLPDLFASKQAATMEKTADNSIGNVTGSNSVNVFLGLGLPWLLASIYWTAQGEVFEVQAGALSFSVVVYSACALVCIVVLMMRRYLKVFGKAELGGRKGLKIACAVFFISMWVLYIVLSSLQAYGHIKTSF